MALHPCPQCGHQVSNAARRCPACGAPNPRYNLPRLALLYVIVFALLGSGFVFLLLSKAKPPQGGQPGYPGVGRTTPM